VREKPTTEAKALPANPPPAEFNMNDAFKFDVPLDGGGMGMINEPRGWHAPWQLPGLRRAAAPADLGWPASPPPVMTNRRFSRSSVAAR
jgi:hypothetical protein